MRFKNAEKQEKHPQMFKDEIYSKDKDLYSGPKVVVGRVGSGKTNFTLGYIKNSMEMGNTVIVFDFSNEGYFSKEIESMTNDKIIINSIKDLDFSFPELEVSRFNDKSKSLGFSDFIKKILETSNNRAFTDKSMDILYGASIVSYLSNKRSLKCVYETLLNLEDRESMISKLSEEYKYIFSPYVSLLKDLTTFENGMMINNDFLISDLINVFDIFFNDINLSNMYNNEKINLNFKDLIYKERKKLIVINIPSDSFKEKITKDIIVANILEKIKFINTDVYSGQIVDIVFDDIEELSNIALLSPYIIESRPKRISFYITTNRFETLKKHLVFYDTLLSRNACYSFLDDVSFSDFNKCSSVVYANFLNESICDIPKHHTMNLFFNGEEYEYSLPIVQKYKYM